MSQLASHSVDPLSAENGPTILDHPSPKETAQHVQDTEHSAEDSEEEVFNYIQQSEEDHLQEEEYFIYPGVSEITNGSDAGDVTRISGGVPVEDDSLVNVQPAATNPSPAQLEAIYAAASSGDIEQLRRLFDSAQEEHGIDGFTLANEATSRTGLTPLHAACSRGHLEVAQWLIADRGAMADLEDKEGEAALNGHIELVKYLVTLEVGKADVLAQDADGYTPLHNACSKGYLDVVRWLCDSGGAADTYERDGKSGRGVDMKSKGGWTPLSWVLRLPNRILRLTS
ncbi:ankyrin repeat-containing domain protein [Cantharellus anzutake]|uniref:ankyrin repeat-containing domain protein n=1 Tax=Cantharellus anzutake TaxID=1750568 RepID=UPI0019037B80|nr:ankyrin repeat-containing domain protein [Cantharellus anzutake]KAF8341513.1 ankyrin repeat-containing domain protein [Cantharellus anzutake]